jgi:hypothetical protein
VTRFISKCAFGIILTILTVLAAPFPLAAQTGSIRLEGTVWDPAGNPLAGAVLTAANENTGIQSEVASDEEGDYKFLVLRPGTYTVTVKAKGFKDVVHRGISLSKPGVFEEIFTIEAAAVDIESPANELPRFINSETSSALSKREMQARPLLNRNPLSQVIYQPGVQIKGGAEGSSTINGTRQAMNSVILDGISITNPIFSTMDSSLMAISPDSISEVQIIMSGGKAEYGRSGGAQFVLTPRSGANSWAGSVYDYFRNKSLNANEYFNNNAGEAKPKLTRNIYGATVSGPVFGQKTLFFANFEGSRTKQEVRKYGIVLTSDARKGLFQWYVPGDTTKDSTTVQSFDIVANDPRHLGIDPAVASILLKLPDANFDYLGDGLNTSGYKFNNPVHVNQERMDFRVDRSINSNHQVFLHFNWNRSEATDLENRADPSFPNEASGIDKEHFWGLTAGSNWTINPRMVNEFRMGYLQPKTDLNRAARSTGPMLLANSWTDPLNSSFPYSYNSKVFEAADTLSHSRGKHIFKSGLDFQRISQGSVDYYGAYPNVTFGLDNGNAVPSNIGPSEQLKISTEDRLTFEKLYNDLLGRIESVSQTFYYSAKSAYPAGTPKKRNFAYNSFAAFIQDDWRITPNLTFNFGLRYEFSSVPEEKNGIQSVLDQASKISSSTNISNFKFISGDWRNQSMKDFAPRFGFAWDIFGTGNTVLRGSYGIYYDRLIGATTTFMDSNSYGFSQPGTLYPNSAGTDIRLIDGIPNIVQAAVMPVSQLPATRSTSVAVFDPNLRTPRIDQYSLTLEKRLGRAVLEAGYVGSRGRRLFQYVNLNQTKTQGGFLDAFHELQAYRDQGTTIPASNPFIRVFGSALAALNAVGGSNVDENLVGPVADTMDKKYYGNYAAAGLSDFYIRNFPQFDKFIVGSSTGNSWYNSLQLGIRASGSSFNLRTHYTWSKSLDTGSSNGSGLTLPSDSFNLQKAPSDFDRPHVVNFAFDYRLPVGRNMHEDSDAPRWVDALLGNWNVGVLYIWESGQRFSVYSGLETAYAGVESFADWVGDRSMGYHYKSEGIDYWFSPDQKAEFSLPGAGSIGTSGRNSFSGPVYSNLDLSLFKNFSIGERQNVQFRIETYNLLNKVRWGLPGANIDQSNFGIISSTVGTPRALQLGLRYQF